MEEQLLFEAGVNYRFQKNDSEVCPLDMREFRYERFKDKKSFGIGRIFILTRQPIDFYTLLDSWNRKGMSAGYSYVGKL